MTGGRRGQWGRRTVAVAWIALVCWAGVVSNAQGAETETLRANYSSPSGLMAPLWLAQDKGLFVRYGLAVDLKYIASGTATQALLSGSLDIVNPGGEILEARLNGEKVVYIAAISNHAMLSLYSRPEILTLSDLRGRSLGVTQPGSTGEIAARLLLREEGMSSGKEVRITYLRSVTQVLAAMSQGTIDAGIFSAPTTLKARQAGLRELVNIAKRNISMIHAALASTQGFLTDHPDRVRRFLQGYVEGIKIARSEPEETKRVIGKYTRTSNPEDLEETYRTFHSAWEKVPYVSAAAVQTLLDFAINPKARMTRPEELIDNAILRSLEGSGFIERLYGS